jgi:hypothetical protein
MIVQPAKLRAGAGDGKPEDGLCLMQMVAWFSGSNFVTDTPACACSVLSVVAIRLNDSAPSQEARDSLWPLVWRLLDSQDVNAAQKRAEYIVREVARRIVAPLLDVRYPQYAIALRRAETMRELGAVARAAADTADIAPDTAYINVADAAARAAAACVVRAAAYAADAAYARAVAFAAADVAAANAACAAAYARTAACAANAAGGAAAWEALRDILIEASALGKHGEEDPVFYTPRAEQLVKLLSGALG